MSEKKAEQASKQVPTIDTPGVRELLKSARDYIKQMSSEPGYGFHRPANPHDFTPDAESCSEEEIAAHRAACEAYDKGEYTPDRGSEWVGAMHILRAPWGIGTYVIRNEYAEKLIAHIDAKLAGQPAAPVAATEQAEIFDFFGQERKGLGWGAWFLLHADTEAEGRAKAAEWQGKRKDRQWKMVSRIAIPADAGAGMTDERAAFEAWMRAEGWDNRLERYNVYDPKDERSYKCRHTTDKWEGWSARARLSTPAAPVTASQPAAQVPIDEADIAWGHDLQMRLLAASQDVAKSEDARQVMAEAACLLAALTGRPGQPAAAHAVKADEWPTHADLLAEDLEKIAESWTGCMYDSIGGMIDIGADLRNQFAKLKLAPQDAAAHAAHDQKGGEK